MPLPWKKTKNPNRISRFIVADLQQPPSLVVQTGFPAAVFDLFLKNRRRIKRRRTSLHNHHFPLLAPPPSPSLSAAAVEFTPPDPELDVVANGHKISNSKFPAVLLLAKMFLAVVPVMSSINLAVSITLSAFLLFLLQMLGHFVARFFNLSIRNRLFSKTTEQEFLSINSASTNEIQIAESYSDYEKLGFHLDGESFRIPENGIGCGSDLEVENEEEGKNERSRSWKLRGKMKKIWSGKRLKRNNNKMKEQEQEEQEVEEEEEEEEEEIGSSTMEKGEEKEEQRKMNLESIVIVMILLGLCGGRFLAFVLTVSGCFIFKFIRFLNQKWKFG